MKRQNRLHFYGLVFLLVGLVVPGLSGTALGAQKKDVKKAVEADVNMNNKKVTKSKTIRKGPDEMRLPGHSITVRVTGDGILRARKVKIKAVKPGRPLTETLSLNDSGDVTHTFNLGSIVHLAQGTYRVTVEQGPADEANYPDPAANVCFDNTTPASRTVTIDNGHRNATVDFTINYIIRWNSNVLCW